MSNGNYLYTVYGVLFGIVISNVLLLKSAIREGLVLFKNFKISLLKKYSSIVNKFLYSSLIRVFIIDPINIALLMIIPIKQYDGQIVSLDIAFTLITAFVFITNSYNTVIFPELSDISKKITS
ncbi:hypothetical protein HC864_04430 [Candidatus Gracilibacteria bacterium]|nr:hypothetical protein [Candidatus Gracilibacteria bacterium]